MASGVRRFATRSAICVHLFRGLRDVRELRHNPIVAHLFAERPDTDADAAILATLLREIALAAAEMVERAPAGGADRARRARSIVARCDLEGELQKVVADDIGLSMRQFYRERLRAVTAIGDILERRIAKPPAPVIESFFPDAFVLGLQQSQTLLHVGRTADAIQLLDRISVDSEDPVRQVRALCTLADALARNNSGAVARDHLIRAERMFSLIDGRDDVGVQETAASLELTRALMHHADGEPAATETALERAFAQIRGMRSSVALREIAVRAHTLSADVSMRRGDAQETLARLDEAGGVLQQIQDPSPAVAVEYYLMLHEASAMAVSDSQATYAYHRAASIAQQNGFAVDATIAAMLHAHHLMQYGEKQQAVAVTREGLRTGYLMPDQQHAMLRLLAAELLIEGGDGATAIACTHAAREALNDGGVDWTRSLMLEAWARLSIGDSYNAVDLAERAIDGFVATGNPRYVGTSLRVLAEGYAGLGRADQARNTIREAIQTLEGYGHPQALLYAYEASARITGNARHAGAARDLHSALTP